MLKHLIGISLINILAIHNVIAEEPVKNSILLTLPKIDWALEINKTDLVLEQKEIASNGKNARFFAKDTKSGIIISGYLEEHPKAGTPEKCRDFYWAKAQKSPFKKDNVVQSDFGEMAIVEYIVPEHKGIKLNQKNVNAYLTKGCFWIDIHLSKTNFKEDEKELFNSILRNITFSDKKQKVGVNYGISNHGILKLDIPASWHDEVHQESDNPPVVITLNPPSDFSSKVLISVLWHKNEKDDSNSPQETKKFVQDAGNKALHYAVENILDIRELKRNGRTGYFYTLTDKAPKPDEYKYMTQGAYGTGKYLLTFTILTNEKNSEVTSKALNIIADSKEVLNKRT